MNLRRGNVHKVLVAMLIGAVIAVIAIVAMQSR
jgi:hypothetical protein